MYLKRLSLVLKREKYPCLLEDEWNTIRRGGGRRGGKGERIARTSDGTTSEVVNLESPQPQPSPSTITNVDDYDGNTSGFIHLASDSLSRSESSFPQSNANNNSTNNTSFPPPPPLLIPSVLTPKILSSLRPRIRPPRKGKDKTIFFLPRTIWVDAIDYHTDQVNILTEMLTNNSYPSPSSSASSSSAPWAFVVFKDLSSAQLAANGVHIRSNPFKACHTVSDIDPSKDLLWENISLKPLSRALRSLLSHGISISVTILWTALNASLLTLLSYDELRKAFPSLPELSELSGSSSDTSTTKNVIRTSIPTIIQIIMLLLLPLLFKRLVRLEGRLSKPEVDISIFRRMSIFLILNFIIFTIVSSTILQSTLNFLNITAMLHDIGESISTSISSFINLLIPLIFIDPAFQMLQLDKLIIVQTVTGLIAKTPRDLFTAVRVTKFEPGRYGLLIISIWT